MKRHSFSPVLVAALVLMVVACASTPPDRIAYNSIDGCVTGVQAAVSAFKAGKAAGTIADPDGSKEAKVKDVYAKFQVAVGAAIDIAAAATTPDQKNQALAIAQAAATSALSIVNAFMGGK